MSHAANVCLIANEKLGSYVVVRRREQAVSSSDLFLHTPKTMR